MEALKNILKTNSAIRSSLVSEQVFLNFLDQSLETNYLNQIEAGWLYRTRTIFV